MSSTPQADDVTGTGGVTVTVDITPVCVTECVDALPSTGGVMLTGIPIGAFLLLALGVALLRRPRARAAAGGEASRRAGLRRSSMAVSADSASRRGRAR